MSLPPIPDPASEAIHDYPHPLMSAAVNVLKTLLWAGAIVYGLTTAFSLFMACAVAAGFQVGAPLALFVRSLVKNGLIALFLLVCIRLLRPKPKTPAKPLDPLERAGAEALDQLRSADPQAWRNDEA